MKILMISDVYFPRVNGVSTSIQTFTQALKDLNHEVHLIAPQYGDVSESKENEHWVTRVSARKIVFDPEDYLMRWSALMALIPSLQTQGYDVVHVHTPFMAHYAGLKIAKALNVPVVETYHTFFEDYLHHYLPWIPRWMAVKLARQISKRQCQQVDQIISPSQPMQDVLRTYGIAKPIQVIPTGLEASRFVLGDGAAFRAQHDIPAERPMLLYVGRVAYEKNIHFLLEVVRLVKDEYPEVLLLITGEGPAEQSLKAKVKDYGLQHYVRFLGYLDRKVGLNACYQAADIFVFASKSETQGLVLLEAMAQATPVVAIAELGTASVLVNEQGALIAQDNEIDFAERVQSLLLNRKRRVALGQSGRLYAQQQWSAQAQAEKLVQCYQAMLLAHEKREAEHVSLFKTAI